MLYGLEQRDRCIEGVGPESLPYVASILLTDSQFQVYDGGIVKRLLDEDGIAALRSAHMYHRDDDSREAPLLTSERMEMALDDQTDGAILELGNVVTQFWEDQGMTEQLGLEVSQRPHFYTTKVDNSHTHIDAIPPSFDNADTASPPILGPLSISVRIDNSEQPRLFYTRRLAERHTPTINSESHDAKRYERLRDRVRRLHYIRKLCFSVLEQQPGDAIVFPGHPWPVIHSTQYADRSWAALFDFQLRRPTEDI